MEGSPEVPMKYALSAAALTALALAACATNPVTGQRDVQLDE